MIFKSMKKCRGSEGFYVGQRGLRKADNYEASLLLLGVILEE